MATLLNSGTLFYTPQGGAQSTAVSNVTSTTVDVTYGLKLSHGASPIIFAVGDTITYVVVIENTGSGSLVNASAVVDLANDVLEYVPDSAAAFLYDGNDAVAFPVTATAGSVVFDFSEAIPGGGIVILTYQATVNASAGETVVSTATVTANEGGETGALLSDSDTATITRAVLSIVKTAPESAAVGDTISYLFTINNTSGSAVSLDALNDRLPEEFSFVALSLTVNGVTVPLTEGVDYQIVGTGELRLDPTSEVVIPAGGTAVVTITGVVTA